MLYVYDVHISCAAIFIHTYMYVYMREGCVRHSQEGRDHLDIVARTRELSALKWRSANDLFITAH